MIALDTDLLVYAHRSALPLHKKSQEAIEKAAEHPSGWAIPFPCVLEFWAVVTHPASRPSPPKEARARIFDLQIGLICRESGVRELWTHDRNFASVPGLALTDPL